MAMHMIKNNRLVSSSYYESLLNPVMADLNAAKLLATSDVARYTDETPDIAFIEGYDLSCFEHYGEVLVAGRGFMDRFGYEPGDEVSISYPQTFDFMKERYLTRYRAVNPGDGDTDETVLEKTLDEFLEYMKNVSKIHRIVGVFTTPSGEYDEIVFTPGEQNATWGLLVAEIILDDNSRLDDFIGYGENIANSTGSIQFVADLSHIEGPQKTLRLLESLYPGALTAALLIGVFLCCLIILQSAKEAAIMRMLGVTKMKTRITVSLEQLLLSAVGLLAGFCGMLVFKGSAMAAISVQMAFFASAYFAAILLAAAVCSALATRRSVLALLQTKE